MWLVWLSLLETIRLNTVNCWTKQARVSCGINPALTEVNGNFNFAGCCELLFKLLHHSGTELTKHIKSLLSCAGMTAIIFSIPFIMHL